MFDELRGLVLETVGLAEPLREALAPLESEIEEYQGFAEVDETLLENLIEITSVLLDKVLAER